jgi:SAM-dependent methyltransferase
MIPLPPLKLREMVGRLDDAAFTNPTGQPVFDDLPTDLDIIRLYAHVFDFGCGCGRQAGQIMAQHIQPAEYVGIDSCAELLQWAATNLSPVNPLFSFHQHVVDSNGVATIKFPSAHFTLVNANSVFTHLLPAQAEFYLRELAKLVTDDGLIRTTWFFFNRSIFPVLRPDQHAIYLDAANPVHAVYFDWCWFQELVERTELLTANIVWPNVLGMQHSVILTKSPDIGRSIRDFHPSPNVIGF